MFCTWYRSNKLLPFEKYFVWNNSREDRSYLTKGWSTDNWPKRCHSFSSATPKISSLSLIIFLIAQILLWCQKLKQLWKISNLITNCTNKEIPKKCRTISKESRYENIRLIPYRKIPVYWDFAKIPYRNKIPHTAGACWYYRSWDFWLGKLPI